MKMKRELLLSFFLIIILLVIGAASAADTNMSDDSTLDLASEDIGELSINDEMNGASDLPVGVVDNDNDFTNQSDEILADGGEKDILGMNVVENEVDVADFGDAFEGNSLSAASEGNNFIGNSNGECILGDSGGVDPSDFNMTEVVDGFKIIIGGIEVNMTQIINNLLNYTNDTTINMTDFLINISDAISINKTEFLKGFEEYNKLFNSSVNLTEKFSDFINNLELNMTDEIESLIDKINSTEIFNLRDVYDLYDAISKENDLNITQIVKALSNVTDGFKLNVTQIVKVFTNPDFNITNITGSLLMMVGSFTVNTTRINEEIEKTFKTNTSKISNIIEGIREIISGIKFNSTNVKEGFETIIAGFNFNNTNISKTIKEILSAFSVNETISNKTMDIILEEFNMTRDDFIFDFVFQKLLYPMVGYLESISKWNFPDQLPDEIVQALNDMFRGNATISEIFMLFSFIFDYNNVTSSEIANMVALIIDGGNLTVYPDQPDYVFSGLNITKFIDTITSPDFNRTRIMDAISELINTTDVNKTKISDEINAFIEAIEFNMTNLYDGLSTMIKGFEYNSTAIMNGLNKIISEIDFNSTSAIDEIIKDAIKINTTSIVDGLTKIFHGFNTNPMDVLNNLLCLNVTYDMEDVSFYWNSSYENIIKAFNNDEDIEFNVSSEDCQFDATTIVMHNGTSNVIRIIPSSLRNSSITIKLTNDKFGFETNLTIDNYLELNMTANDAEYVNDAIIVTGSPTIDVENIKLTINETEYPYASVNGTVVTYLPHLEAGTYIAKATYVINGISVIEKTTTFNVLKANMTLEIACEIVNNKTCIVNVTALDDLKENITISIGGDVRSVQVIGGKATATFENLSSGPYTVEVSYAGDRNYNSTSNSTEIFIKYPAVINFNVPSDAKVDDSIEINIDKGTTDGEVTAEINGEIQDLILGLIIWYIPSEAKEYTVVVTTAETDTYLKGSLTKTFTVTKNDFNFKMTTEIINNNTCVVNVTAPSDLENNITISIGEDIRSVKVIGQKASATFENLLPDFHTVEVSYDGDRYYNSSSISREIFIKYPAVIDIGIPETIRVDDTVTIQITTQTDGEVTAEINGEPQEIIDGTITYKFDEAKTYTIVVNSTGTGTYLSGSETKTFEVLKHDPNLKIKYEIINYTICVVNVTAPDDLAENITIGIGEDVRSLEVIGGKANATFKDLTPGFHYLDVSYVGDRYYNSTENITEIFIKTSINITIEIQESDIKVDDTITIRITAETDGELTAFINDQPQEIIDNLITYKVETAGLHTILVNSAETANYTEGIAFKRFNAARHDFIVEIATEIINNNTCIVNVTAPDGLTENITIGIGCDVRSVKVIGGKASATFENLSPDFHTVEVSYVGDRYYNSTENSTRIFIKYPVTFDIVIPEGIKVDDTITIQISTNTDGVLTAEINGTVQEIINNNITCKVDKAGTYTLVINSTETDTHLSGSTTKTFTVTKHDFIIEVVTEIINNVTCVVKVTATEGLTENITIGLGGDVRSVQVIGGKANATFKDLKPGFYPIDVKYEGDRYFNPSENNTIAVFIKFPVTFGIVIPEVIKVDDTFIIQISTNTDGVLTAEINGTAQEIINNNITCKVDKAGTYTLTINSTETPFSLKGSTTKTFTVTKHDFIIEVATEIINNNTCVVNVTAPEGLTENITIAIGEDVRSVQVIGGKASATFEGLAPDNHTVDVSYVGDRYYNSTENSTNIFIKYPVTFDIVIPEGIKVDGTITIQISTNTDGVLTAEINGTAQKIINNNITCKVDKAGTYTLVINSTETDTYLSGSITKTFSVTKYDTVMEVNVNKTTQKDPAVFEILLPTEATGTVTVSVDNITQTVDVNNGKATAVIAGLNPGNYTATITYSGNYKFSENTTTKEFKVTDENILELNIDMPAGSTSPTIKVTLPSDATGNLTVTVDGKNYTATLNNGSASITVPSLSYGNHDISVAYSGDENYPAISKKASLNIPKPVIAANNIKISYSSKTPYKVRVTADGKAVVGQYVTFKFNGKTKKVLTDKNGYASFKIPTVKPKTYKITATFNGFTKTNKVTVKNIIKAKNKKVKKSAKKLIIKVTLKKVDSKYLKGKKLKLKIKGKTVRAKTNKKGVAKFKIKKKILKKLKAGKKYKYTVTYGKDRVTKKLTVKR